MSLKNAVSCGVCGGLILLSLGPLAHVCTPRGIPDITCAPAGRPDTPHHPRQTAIIQGPVITDSVSLSANGRIVIPADPKI